MRACRRWKPACVNLRLSWRNSLTGIKCSQRSFPGLGSWCAPSLCPCHVLQHILFCAVVTPSALFSWDDAVNASRNQCFTL